MSIQYKDNSFSDNMDLDEAMKRFQKEITDGVPIKALFVGTENELEGIKAEQSIMDRVDELEKKVDNMRELESDLIIIPTKEEIKKIG